MSYPRRAEAARSEAGAARQHAARRHPSKAMMARSTGIKGTQRGVEPDPPGGGGLGSDNRLGLRAGSSGTPGGLGYMRVRSLQPAYRLPRSFCSSANRHEGSSAGG